MKKTSIKYNALMNIILTLSNIVFPLITFPYISRVLAPEGVGITNFFSSVGAYAILVATLGIGTYGIRQVSTVRNNKKELTKTTQELIIINLIMAVVVVIILFALSLFIKKFSSEMMLVIIISISVLSSVFSLNWLYSGLEQYNYITQRSLLFKFISLILIFIFVREKEDYIIYMAITLFSTLSSNLLNVYNSRNFISFKLVKDLEFMKHIKPLLYLFSSLLAVNIYTNLDTVMLGFMSDDISVGLYSVASKVKWLLLMLITSGSAVLLPRLSFYVSKNNQQQYNKILKESTTLIFLIAIPMSIYFIFAAKNSIVLLGGEKFIPAVFSMQILMPILLISGFSNITGNQILLPFNKEKYFMYAVTSGAIVNLILNLILIPKYGIVGASIATLVAEFCQMTVQVCYSKKYLIGNIAYASIAKIVFSTVFSSIVLYITIKIDIYKYSVVTNFILMGIIFFIMYLIVLLILKEKMLKNILSFRK